jgi:hypothetical protein
MSEKRLRSLLRDTPVPGADDAERRGLRMVEEAYAQRRPVRRPAPPRLAVALAVAALLAALMLSPAGAAVRDWVGGAFETGVPNAEPALTRIPGGGRLLVRSQAGPWVVRPDGSRRLLGDYAEATWSPHGLFVAAASGETLSAVEPDGTPHWSLSVGARVSDPAWSPSGLRIAYRAGRALRVVAADGTGDALLDPSVAPLPPAWSPSGLSQLAYVDADARLEIVDADNGRRLLEAPALPGVGGLEWAAGSVLLETSPAVLRVRHVAAESPSSAPRIGRGRRIRVPARATIRDAAISPRGGSVAALVVSRTARGPRSEVILIAARSDATRQLIKVRGRLGSVTWSPDSRRLLISWPEADQWLFLPIGRHGKGRAIGDVTGAFAPGGRGASFPSVAGWCCSTATGHAAP